MLRELNNIRAFSTGLGEHDRPTETGLATTKLPVLSALSAQQSSMCPEAGGVVRIPEFSGKPLSCRSITGQAQPLSFSQWAQISCGIRQRMEAVSACLNEIFTRAAIPRFLVQNASLVRTLRALTDQIGVVRRDFVCWGWLASTDLYVASDGEISVTDQNFSVPAGLKLLTRVLDRSRTECITAIHDLGRRMADSSTICGGCSDASSTMVLDPGRYSPTFSENDFLARTIDAQITRASDMVVTKDGIELVTGIKRTRIHTIVRRIDDDLLDPNCFRPDSLVGLPGLCKAWKNGLVNLVNPPGSSVASIRSFTQLVPAMIRTFLGEEPALPITETYECSAPDTMQNLIENPARVAVRTNDPMHPARPYFGNSATKAETLAMLNAVRRHPDRFVTRNLLPGFEPRGFSLRVFSSMAGGFCMPCCGIGRECQSDGGATLAINDDESAFFVH